jgi:hypothetical protein
LSVRAGDSEILLVHDGELEDVAALLRELAAGFTQRCGAPRAEDATAGWRLVIASARRALELPADLLRSSAYRIAILEGESRTLRALLRRARFELVVRRPVHPAALRLLVLHALYRGPEKRRKPRVSVGAPVHLRIGLRRRRAILAELSERGCRLLTSQRASAGRALTLLIPAKLGGGRAFSVKGRVVRSAFASRGAAGVLTLSFDAPDASVLARLRAVVAIHTTGPSPLDAATPPPPRLAAAAVAPPAALEEIPAAPLAAASAPPAPPQGLPSDPTPAGESSGPARPPAARRVVPLSDAAARVVLARDVSRQGMRADASPRLASATALRLALHVLAGEPPLVVQAQVEPGPSDEGVWLRFKELAPAERDRLDAVIGGLSVFDVGDGRDAALVVCEILDAPEG